MDKTLVKKSVIQAFIGVMSDLTKKEIEELQDLLSVKMHKISDTGESISLKEVKKEFVEKIDNARKSPKVKVSTSEQAKILGL